MTGTSDPWAVDSVAAMNLSAATRHALECDRVLKIISADAASDLGRSWVLGLVPTAEPALIEERQRDTAAVTAALNEHGKLVPSGLELVDVVDSLKQSGLEIETEPTRRLASGVVAAEDALRALKVSSPDAKVCDRDSQPALADWAKFTLQALDEQGMVRDDASPKLLRLTQTGRRQRQRLRATLDGYLKEHPTAVAQDTISVRDGRMTVLLRSNNSEGLTGLRHGSSGTGQSTYFEPLEVVDSNNELRQTNSDIEREKQRILNEILDFIAAHRQDFLDHLFWLGRVDGLQAVASWGALAESKNAANSSLFALKGFRHPLLDERFEKTRERLFEKSHRGSVQPLDASFDESVRLLMLTGPNAGGKTVAVKTAGLAVFLNQCGLPLPVDEARMPLFDHLVAVVGDEQDLMADRSTFSARLLRLHKIWERAGDHSLVILDELGSGTDPEEGGAMAVALLEELLRRGSLTLATTHLVSLASFAVENERGQVAAMEFDGESGQPTFRLLLGMPGESHALDLARRLNLDNKWIARSEDLLGEERVSLARLLGDLERERQQLEQASMEQRQLNRQLESEKSQLQSLQEELRQKDERREIGLRQQQDAFERKALRKIDRHLDELRAQVESQAVKNQAVKSQAKGHKLAPTKRGEILAAATQNRPKIKRSKPTAPLAVGDAVRHRLLGWTGEVLSVQGKKVQVSASGKRIWVGVSDLEPHLQVDKKASKTTTKTPRLDEFNEELHLRGLTVDDALDQLENFVADASANGASTVRIIHGHGTGRLRSAVRQAMSRHPLVADSRPGGNHEGGNGATIVTLVSD